MRRARATLLMAMWAATMLACGGESHEGGETCLNWGWSGRTPVSVGDAVDVLFVVDEAPGIAEAQTALTAELAAFVEAMTIDRELDGRPLQAVTDLHVAVLSPDLGAEGFRGNGCGDGREGVFTSTADAAGCETEYPRFLRSTGTAPACPRRSIAVCIMDGAGVSPA